VLTLEDCIALSELTDEEIAAIAEHEHLPMIVAAECGNYLIHSAGGVPRIKRIIAEDIVAARKRGDRRHALALKLVLRHFIENHAPPAERRRAGDAEHDRILRDFLGKLPLSGAPATPAAPR